MAENASMSRDGGIGLIGFDELGTANGILQTAYWADLKRRFGWRGYAIRIPGNEGGTTALVLIRSIRPGITLAYVPHGPALPESGGPTLADIAASLPELTRRRIDLVRFDLPEPRGSYNEVSTALRNAPVTVQPPDTVIVDLTATDDDILGGMKPKTRYNIRLAAKRGVEVFTAGAGEIDRWYELYRETAARDRIAIHSLEYYRTLVETAAGYDDVDCLLQFASVDGEPVAGNIVGICGDMGYYLLGASSNRHRNLMPTYLLQWEGMITCRDRGCKRYDLWGIPPTDEPGHPMHGLYRMKTGFGGEIIHRAGAVDYLVRPVRAKAYRTAERAREFYFKNLRKRSR